MRLGLSLTIADFPSGAPCWSDLLVTDTEMAKAFYSAVLGWVWRPGDAETGGYEVATVDGHPVAGISHRPEDAPIASQWTTYLRTFGAQSAGEAALRHGGRPMTAPVRLGRLGRTLIARDPSGALFGLWEPGALPGYGAIGPAGTPVWNELLTKHYDQVQTFYSALFRHTYTEEAEPGQARWSTARTRDGNPAYGLSEIGADFGDLVKPHWIVAFRPDDLVHDVSVALDFGATLLHGPYEGPYGVGAVLRGLEGEVFSLLVPHE